MFWEKITIFLELYTQGNFLSKSVPTENILPERSEVTTFTNEETDFVTSRPSLKEIPTELLQAGGRHHRQRSDAMGNKEQWRTLIIQNNNHVFWIKIELKYTATIAYNLGEWS